MRIAVPSSAPLYWNGQSLDRQQLLNQLAGAAALTEQPQIRFDPDPRASSNCSAQTIALIKDSGIEKFAFIGNEQYRAFGTD